MNVLRKTKTTEEIEDSIWGRLTRWVMQHPLKVAIPIVVGLLLLIIPFDDIKFGGINEKYLPPDNPTRVAQEQFDELFPSQRTEPIKLVIDGAQSSATRRAQIAKEANNAPGSDREVHARRRAAKDGVIDLQGRPDRPQRRRADRSTTCAPSDVPDGATDATSAAPRRSSRTRSTRCSTDLPLMIVLVVLRDDAADVPGVRIAGAADQGGADDARSASVPRSAS